MRIIISFYYDFLRKKTAAIDIEDEDQDCSVLLKAISVKVEYPIHELVAIIKKDNIPVRIIQGWPISFYEIKDKSCIHVEFKENDQDEAKKKGNALNNRYLMKLGINKQEKQLSVIKDFDDDEEDAEGDKNTSFQKKSSQGNWKGKNSQNRSQSSSSDDEIPANINTRKILENYVESLVREIKNNKLEEVKKILSEVNDKLTKEQQEELINQRKKVLDELGNDGFSPLHHAAQQKNSEICKELIERGANVNIPNVQGWTSIQISIHKNDLKTLKVLLESPTVDLNYISQVGTALSIACKFSKPQALQILLEKEPDIEILDLAGKTCLEVCAGEECKNLLKAYQKSKAQQEEEMQRIEQMQIKQQAVPKGPFMPPRPPIICGVMHKISSILFTLRERYFVINPDEGTLIRYKSASHYPFKPLEVIPLKEITHIQVISRSWFMSSSFSYFEINYPTRQVLACRHEAATKKWVEYLFQASVYSYYIESQNSQNVVQLPDNQQIELLDQSHQERIAGGLGGSLQEAIDTFQSKGTKQNQIQEPINQPSIQSPSKENKLKTAEIPNKNLQSSKEERKNNASPTTIQPITNGRESSKAKKDRSLSPMDSANSSNSTQACSLQEDPNVDLGSLQDEKVTFDSFQILKVLGQGSFGKVFLSKKKDTGVIYAIKALKKRPLIQKRQLRYAVTEANVLKMCNHPFILGLHFALQTPNYLYLVVDFCSGGDIGSHLVYKQKFTEQEAVFYISELVLAIQHIHEKDVVYRDLKPENILISGDGHIKLADFGLSKDNVTDQSKTKSFCGTPAYLSPEMLNNKGASKASDLYGIGAVLYEMLTGDPPYYNDDIPTMYKKIKEGNLTFPSYVSQKAKNFINGLLDRNPKTRLGAQDREALKRDPFFENLDWEKVYNKQYPPPITEFENSDIEDDFDDISDKDFDYEDHNKNSNRVKEFSFIRR